MLFGSMIDKKYITGKREPFFEIAREFFNDKSVVLDVGCGHGSFSNYFEEKDFFLFEGNKQTVNDLIKEGHKNVFLGNLPNLPFDDKQFDLIHCSHVVEHLEIRQFYKTLKEMDRCLKPEGVIVISAPLMWDGFFDDLSHIRPYPPIVFKNYMCSKNTKNRTGQLISSDYEMVKEVYRYFEENPFQGLLNTKNNFFIKLYIFFKKWIHKMGLRKYKKTGYTVVLKKMK